MTAANSQRFNLPEHPSPPVRPDARFGPLEEGQGEDSTPLLEISDLRIHFDTQGGRVHALNGVDLTVNRGEIVGLVGETGSGKSVTARASMRLLDRNGYTDGGRILFEGRDLLLLSDRAMRDVRGKEIAMVFQDARNSLNPVFSVGHQLGRIASVHNGMGRRRRRPQLSARLQAWVSPTPSAGTGNIRTS
jgi:ABC-type dipeptide/oligopeptide/nickel transport system ATPase component